MAFALLSHTTKALQSSGATAAIDTTGATLLVVAQAQGAAYPVAVVSDSKGNTWTHLTARSSSPTGAGAYLQIHWCRPTTVGVGHTFSLTGSGLFYGALAVAAFSGATAVPYDGEAGQSTQIPTQSYSPGPITPTQNNDVVITALTHTSNVAGATIDKAFVITDVLQRVSGINVPVALAYLAQSTAAQIAPTWGWTGSSEVAAVIAAFRSVNPGQVVAPAVADTVYSTGVASLGLAPSSVSPALVSAPRSIGAVTASPVVVARSLSLVSAPQAIGHLVAADPATPIRAPALVSAPQAIGAVTTSQVARSLTLVSAPRAIGAVLRRASISRTMALVSAPRAVGAVATATRQMGLVSAPQAVGHVVAAGASTVVRQLGSVAAPRVIGGVLAAPSGVSVRSLLRVESSAIIYHFETDPPGGPPFVGVDHLTFTGILHVPGGTDLNFTGTIDVPTGALP